MDEIEILTRAGNGREFCFPAWVSGNIRAGIIEKIYDNLESVFKEVYVGIGSSW